jgi:WD40 repeat protein
MFSPNNHQEIPDCPYQGLMPYLEEQADFFFGREKWSAIITDNLMVSRLTILYGTSGVGKTSVLRAGVAHHLRQLAQKNLKESGQPEFAVVVFSAWRDEPVAGLVQKVEKDVKKILPAVKVPEPGTSLAKTLENWAKVLVTDPERSGKLLIILDQFEEYFQYHSHKDGEGTFAFEFPRAINESGLPVNFLISLREDTLAKLDHFKGRISNLFGNYLRIPHLDEESAVDAIRKPLGVFNQHLKAGEKSIGIETELVQEVLEQVKVGKVSFVESGKGGRERPSTAIETSYLQLVMERLWKEEMKIGSDCLRLETFKRLGEAKNIVKQHLNERMEPLSREEKKIAAQVFQYLVTPGGTKITYPALELAEKGGGETQKLEELLRKLSSPEQRILRSVGPSSEKPNVERYEIFHDKLAPAILEWRKEYLHKQEELRKECLHKQEELRKECLHKRAIKRWQLITTGVASLAFIFVGLLIWAEYQRLQAAVSETKAILASSNARLVSQEYFDSLIDGLRSFRNLKYAENNWASGWLLNHKTKDIALDIQKVLQQDLAQVNESNRLTGHEEEVVDISFSPDRNIIATASQDGTVKLWNLEGKQIKSFSAANNAKFWGISFSPKGQILAAASTDGTVRLWRLNGKDIEEVEPLKVSQSLVWDISFSPDGQVLASADSSGTVKLWQFDGDKFNPDPIYQIKAHDQVKGEDQEIHKINFSPDGKFLATASIDNTAKLWRFDGQKIEFLRTLKGHTDSLWDVTFSPDSRTIATASSDNNAKLWNLEGKEIKTLSGHKQGVLSASFATYEQNKELVVATASDDNTIKLWNLKGEEIITLTGHINGVWRASFSPNGKFLATASRDKTVKLWNLNPQSLFGHTLDVFQVKFSPDGKILATASKDGTVKLWSFDPQDIRYIHYLKTLKLHDNFVTAVSFSPDGSTIATASADTTAKIWNLDGKLLKSLDGNQEDTNLWMWDVSFSLDGRTIATASSDKTAKLWTFNKELPIFTINHDATVRSLSFSRDGKILATGSRDKIVKLWSLDGENINQIGEDIKTGHKKWLMSVSLSPSGDTLATASQDGSVKLWSLGGGEIRPVEITPKVQSSEPKICRDSDSRICHNFSIISVDFNREGNLLATASEDETVKLWNLEGRLLNTFFGHIGGVLDATFSPDGKFIASSGKDGRVIIWNRDHKLEDVVKESCNWVRGYLENNTRVKEDDNNRSQYDQYQSLCQDIDQYIKPQN